MEIYVKLQLKMKVLFTVTLVLLTNSNAVAVNEATTQVQSLEVKYGEYAAQDIYLNENLSDSNIRYDGELLSTYDTFDSGYMAKGMGSLIPNNMVADANISLLFGKYAGLKKQSNVDLPTEFDTLIYFISSYIGATSKLNAAANNGFTHLKLATEVVRASFCFGTDPFMVLAKIRRETSFDRTGVSSGAAVGFSQMTGAGIDEVQEQMSGDSKISVANAKSEYQEAINCFSGYRQFDVPTGGRVAVQNELKKFYRLDLTFGQILTKTYVAYSKSLGAGNTINSYKAAFALYNGDRQSVRGVCLGVKSVELKFEYACDIVSYYSRLSKVWNDFLIELRREKDT